MRKNKVRNFLRSLLPGGELNDDPGPITHTRVRLNKKKRRQLVRKQGRIQDKVPLQFLRENCLEDNDYYEPWFGYDDGYYNWKWNELSKESEKRKIKLRKAKKRKV